jgi:hypothetical protein
MRMTTNGFNNEPTVLPTGFRIRRAQATVTGFQPSVDEKATIVLQELDGLLKKRIFPAALDDVRDMLNLDLTSRRVEKAGVGKWANGSLADKLRDEKESAGERVLGEVIDADSDLAALRYGFDESLDDRWTELDFNVKAVLGYSGVRDLLVLRAYTLFRITAQPSLINFVLNHPSGVSTVVSYAAVSAAREYVDQHRLRVKEIDKDDSDSVKAIEEAGLSLSSESLEHAAIDTVTAYTVGTQFNSAIAAAKAVGVTVPDELRPRLIQYLKLSEVEITTENAPFMVPMYLVKAAKAAKAATTSVTTSGAQGEDPFAVSFFVDDAASLQISTAAVNCAAQLYFVMVLGDEFEVFDAMRYFTHRYLFRDGFAVEDPQLRHDLENYVFSEQFPGRDDQTGDQRIMRCTRAGERRSFYRQIFDQGSEPVPGGGIPNTDFGRLWKILMLESARYLEKAQFSPHPDNFVSRQNVMQAVEDLQYNLSTTCVGMATVLTPLMYSELDFVITRIFQHAEVRKHLVPSGGSWWKVVEKLLADQGKRVRAPALNNKAQIGYTLIRDIASYVPSQFEQDGPFSGFISNVDAFITTQSIIQEEAARGSNLGDIGSYESGTGGRGGNGGYGEGPLPGMPDLSSLPGMPSIPGVSAPWPGSPGGTTAGNGSSADPRTSLAPAEAGSAGDWDF